MGWKLVQTKTESIWECLNYSDLNYAEITNLAEYGQPYSPYEKGFDHKFVPDFGKVIVQMSQSEVMTNGYGANISALSFPIVRKFLYTSLPSLPGGPLSFADLVKYGVAKKSDKWLKSNLYGANTTGISAGAISAGDAAYIHGTVGFALMKGTTFSVSMTKRQVSAEIGAGDDNWDFNSSSIPDVVNAFVAAVFGPDHYNLTAPIQIRFRGTGKTSTAQCTVPRAIRARAPSCR